MRSTAPLARARPVASCTAPLGASAWAVSGPKKDGPPGDRHDKVRGDTRTSERYEDRWLKAVWHSKRPLCRTKGFSAAASARGYMSSSRGVDDVVQTSLGAATR